MVTKRKARRPVRGEAQLGINQKTALWKDLVSDAKGGTEEEPVDTQTMNAARRIVAERIWPKLKPEARRLDLDVPEDTTIDQKLTILLQAAMTGQADVGAVTELINSIGSTYAIKANNELLEKFSQLENELAEWRSTQAIQNKPSLRRSRDRDEENES